MVGIAIEERLPGLSPFHSKGIVWLSVQQIIEARVPGGVAAVCKALPSHADYLSQMFLASGWYDVLPVVQVTATAAELAGTTHEEYVKTSGRLAAHEWMNGVHRSILKQQTPVDVCRRFSSMLRQLYDFGEATLIDIQPSYVEALTRGIPEPFAWWWEVSSIGYVEVLLEAAGAKNGSIRFHERALDTPIARIDVVSIGSTTYWD